MKARGTLLTYGSNREMQGAFTEALDRGGIRRRRRNRMLKKGAQVPASSRGR